MSLPSVNLASRPFSNQAPVLRVAIVLGLISLSLMVANVALYWSYFSGSGEEARVDLEAVEQRIAAVETELRELDRELATYDVGAMSSQVGYLNLRIAERAFPWSRLFEDLGEVLPREVRLERLSPRMGRFITTEEGPSDVLLTLEGRARRDEAFLDLTDNLFAHPRFEKPDPSRQIRRDGELQFSLTVVYHPFGAGASEDAAEGEES